MRDRETRDVVFTFSYETWDDAMHRGMMRPPDRIVTSLLRSRRVRRLLVANPFRSAASVALRRGGDSFPKTELARLVTPTRLRRTDPASDAALRRTYARYGTKLGRAAARAGLQHPVVITTHPLVAGFGDLGWADGVLYFGRDDWASSPARRHFWPAYRSAYERIAEGGVRVATVSEQILERIRPSAPSAVMPNGIDPLEWQGGKPSVPAWLDAIPGPRAIYTGTIDSRLDVPGLLALSRQRPDVSFVLLGPVADREHVRPLDKVANVFMHPSVGHAELVSATRNADVALVAHVRSPLTEAMSPLKAYEYVAAGLPVVSIDLAPMRLLAEYVYFAPTVEGFGKPLTEALEAGRLAEERRIEFLERNSWSARHEVLFDLIF